MAIISLQDISKHFIVREKRHVPLYRDIMNTLLRQKEQKIIKALEGINLEIKKGEKVGFVGRNGAGKSTLLRLIASIYHPTSGEINIRGHVAPFLQSGLRMAPSLAVIDNLKLYGAIIGLSRSQIEQSKDQILQFAELQKFEFVPLELLSRGMQQRLFCSVLYQTLHHRTSNIYIFDESLSAGDARFKEKSDEFLGSLRKSDKTVLIVSHTKEWILNHCDRAILLDEGRIVATGSPQDVMYQYDKLTDQTRPHRS